MPVSHMTYDIFLSYAPGDRPVVAEIARILQEIGLRPWFDGRCIIPGKPAQEQIVSGLTSSRAIALCLGDTGAGQMGRSDSILFSRLLANDSAKRTIVVLLPGCKASEWHLSYLSRAHEVVNFRAGLGDLAALHTLLAGICHAHPNRVLPPDFALAGNHRSLPSDDWSILKRNTIRSYDRLAEQFTDVWFDHPPQQPLEQFLACLGKRSNVLDAGCGPGHHARYLARHGHRVLGIDLSDEMLQIAKKSVREASFFKMDIQHLELCAQSFDGIWCAASALHVPREEVLQLLVGYKRVLRPGGVLGLNLLIGRPSEVVEHGQDKRFFEHYEDGAEIARILHFLGFEVVGEEQSETRRNTQELDLTLPWVTLYARPRPGDFPFRPSRSE